MRFLTLAFALFLCTKAFGLSYSVDFEGLNDASTLKAIKSASQLTSLKKRPPASINALRYRAESDIPDLIKVLHAHGYYEASVHVRIEEIYTKTRVVVIIDPGPQYTLGAYTVLFYSDEETVECDKVTLENIGIHLGRPAKAQEILNSELKTLQLLSSCGYPLAEIAKREMIADGETRTIQIHLEVQTGQLAYFGPVEISGITRVKPLFIEQKEQWKKGQVYDSSLVEKTQNALMDSGLFSSVLITHDKDLQGNQLPMKIEVMESKHRSVNVGASYQTFYGFGLTFGWENRNVGGMGRKLNFQGDITQRSHSGVANYLIQDFRRIGQDLLFKALAAQETVLPYSSRSYSYSNRLERKFKKNFRAAITLKLDRLLVTNSVQNGNYVLLEAPLYFRWSTANDLLNPTKGFTLEYKAIPTFDITNAKRPYLSQNITQSTYFPVTKSEVLVLAQKVMFDFLFSNELSDVPVPNRFFGGSEEELRGYRYRSVSPLHDHHKPIGGRSAIFYTFETRFRVSKTIGLVPFFDLGSVYLTQLPTFKGEWFKSVGLGVRYFSFLGPIRLDVGFPLDRRSHIDPVYRVLVSIGQMF